MELSELQECIDWWLSLLNVVSLPHRIKILRSLQHNMVVPCLMHSARSHLNEVLIKFAAIKKGKEKRSSKQWRRCSRFGRSSWKRRLRSCHTTRKGGRWRLDKDMKGIWMMNQISTMKTFLSRQWNFVCFFVTSAGYG